MRRAAILLSLLVFCFAQAGAAEMTLHLRVAAPTTDRVHAPVKVMVELPEEFAEASGVDVWVGNELLPGQLTRPGLLAGNSKAAEGHVVRELHFVLLEAKAGKPLDVKAEISGDDEFINGKFTWGPDEGTHIDVVHQMEPDIRYMKEDYDDSTPENRERTYKVFHHVFAPGREEPITKGPGGQYTHHRGIFYGFSRTSYGENLEKKADIWHCKGGVHQSHEGVVSSEAGPALARHLLNIDWHGDDKKVFAKEQRELTLYLNPKGLLIEFASKLKAVDGKLKLDGDPQHAGFQFRASNEVSAKTASNTYYVRPDGIDKPGSYKQGQQQAWNAMSFVVGGERFTACYLDHHDNPKPAFYSERNYGRFGSYFVAETEGDKTIDVNYRLWLKRGEMTVEEVATHAKNFVEPLSATVK